MCPLVVAIKSVWSADGGNVKRKAARNLIAHRVLGVFVSVWFVYVCVGVCSYAFVYDDYGESSNTCTATSERDKKLCAA